MTQDDNDILAAEYVLGTLETDARDRFHRALEKDPVLQSQVASWQEGLGALADRHTSEAPSASVWAAIAAGIDEAPLANTTTIRAAEGSWQSVSPGAAIKILFENPDDGYRSFLLRMEPGGRLPGHVHAYTEECLVLEGELIIGYNPSPLKRNTVLSLNDEHSRLQLAEVRTWWWNLHEVLIFKRTDAGSHQPTTR